MYFTFSYMARLKDREKAIKLRKQGKSYSEIKNKLDISKSTLSGWLQDYPLSKEDLVRLRDKNPIRIEKFRQTMAKKRKKRLGLVYEKMADDIGLLSKREIFIAGLFLYWAEGTKRARYTTALANTDPSMIIFFLRWLSILNVPKNKIGVRLQLYADMSIKDEVNWWSGKIGIAESYFKKPYIKKTKQNRITYKGGYGHGTCNIVVHDRDINECVMMGIKYLQKMNTN